MAQVDLGIYYNCFCFISDGTKFDRRDDALFGKAMSFTLLGSTVNWNNTPFALGPPGEKDAVEAMGQAIKLPEVKYSALSLLATNTVGWGNNGVNDLAFTVTYTDETTQRFTQSMSGCFRPRSCAGESIAVPMSYWNQTDGSRDNTSICLYGYTFDLNPEKTVRSITLPNNTEVRVFAITLRQRRQ